MKKITTPLGITVTLSERGPEHLVLLDQEGHDTLVAGRITRSRGFQPVAEPEYALRPSTLRAIADLIENHQE